MNRQDGAEYIYTEYRVVYGDYVSLLDLARWGSEWLQWAMWMRALCVDGIPAAACPLEAAGKNL
jgi:hypothetical protein